MYALPGQSLDAGARRHRARDRLRAAARLRLPPHARAEHALPPLSAGASRRRRRRRHAGGDRGDARARGLRALRDLGLRAARPALRATTSTTGASATTSASAPAPTARSRFPTASCARCAASSRRPTWTRGARGRRDRRRRARSRAELPFEFMLNALRLIDGFPVALFAQRTGPADHRGRGAARRGRSRRPARARPRAHPPTPAGQRFLNDLLGLFLPEAKSPPESVNSGVRRFAIPAKTSPLQARYPAPPRRGTGRHRKETTSCRSTPSPSIPLP